MMKSIGKFLHLIWNSIQQKVGLLILCTVVWGPTPTWAQAPSPAGAAPQQGTPPTQNPGGTPPPGQANSVPPGQAASPSGSPESSLPDINTMVTAPKDLLMGIIERFEYDPADLRDPFTPYNPSKGGAPAQGPVLPLQRFDLEQLKITAIIWDVADPKAMIEDPQGNTNLVRMNERVGRNNGYIAAIREGEVVVVEAFDNAGNISYKTRIMKVGGDKKAN